MDDNEIQSNTDSSSLTDKDEDNMSKLNSSLDSIGSNQNLEADNSTPLEDADKSNIESIGDIESSKTEVAQEFTPVTSAQNSSPITEIQSDQNSSIPLEDQDNESGLNSPNISQNLNDDNLVTEIPTDETNISENISNPVTSHLDSNPALDSTNNSESNLNIDNSKYEQIDVESAENQSADNQSVVNQSADNQSVVNQSADNQSVNNLSVDHLSNAEEVGDTLINDFDSVEESIDQISQGQNDLQDELSKLEHMSEAGKIDKENQDDIEPSLKSDQIDQLESVLEQPKEVSETETTELLKSEKNDLFDSNELSEHETADFMNQSNQSIEHSDESQVNTLLNDSNSSHEEVIDQMDQLNESLEDQQSEQMVSNTPEQFDEPVFQNKRNDMFEPEKSHDNSLDEDIKTVMTDNENRPLTQGDKEVILDELEGKPIPADVHINHKSIESLHHINVYHYLPPKFISANSMPNMYPGMGLPQQQQMSPGPIINIHNSTTSSGGNGGNNNGSNPSGQGVSNTVAAAPSGPSQNWGQVVYSNSHHGSQVAAANQVAPVNQVTPVNPVNQAQQLDNLESQPQIQVDQEPVVEQQIISPMMKEASNQVPDVISDEPIISSDNIKIEPVINSDVINETPIEVLTPEEDNSEKDESEKDNKSQESDVQDDNSGSSENLSEKNPSEDITETDLDRLPISQDNQEIDSPDELNNVDEETVQIDPDAVNDENGQTVVLGDEPNELKPDDIRRIII